MNKRKWEEYAYGLTPDDVQGTKLANYKAVLLCLVYHSDWDTGRGITASALTIARETGLHRNTVNTILELMEENEILVQVGIKSYDKNKRVRIFNLSDAQIDVHAKQPSDAQVESSDAQIDVHAKASDAQVESSDAQIDVHNHTKDNHTQRYTKETIRAHEKVEPSTKRARLTHKEVVRLHGLDGEDKTKLWKQLAETVDKTERDIVWTEIATELGYPIKCNGSNTEFKHRQAYLNWGLVWMTENQVSER